MLNNLINEQLLYFKNDLNFFISLYSKKKLPQTILLTGDKGIGKFNFAYHLINFILSQEENEKYDLKSYKININNKTSNLLSQNIHPNFHMIYPRENKNSIEVNQIKTMQNFLYMSSFNKLPKIVLINGSEYLNLSSANSLLKSLEEKYENVFFILIQDIKKNLLLTIKSRCIQFKFNLTDKQLIKRVDEILNNQYDSLNPDFKNKYLNPIFYKDLLNYSENNQLELNKLNLDTLFSNIFNEKNYKKNEFANKYFLILIQLFVYKRIRNSLNHEKYFNLLKYFTRKFDDVRKFNLDFESYVLEFKYTVYNEK